jgi:hypothetical protein
MCFDETWSTDAVPYGHDCGIESFDMAYGADDPIFVRQVNKSTCFLIGAAERFFDENVASVPNRTACDLEMSFRRCADGESVDALQQLFMTAAFRQPIPLGDLGIPIGVEVVDRGQVAVGRFVIDTGVV